MYSKKFSRLFSCARVSRYVKAARGDKKKAQKMYYANARLARAFQPLLSFFEVILRNQLHYALAAHFRDVQWLINQKAGFMSDPSLIHIDKKTGKVKKNHFLKDEVQRAEKELQSRGKNITSGRIIAELNFGFWNSLYETHHYALLKGVPCQIFMSLPAGYGRKDVNIVIQEIRMLRNRVSHNEPLCFNNRKFDMSYVKDKYAKIRDFLSWINPEILSALKSESLDCVAEEIGRTEEILK